MNIKLRFVEELPKTKEPITTLSLIDKRYFCFCDEIDSLYMLYFLLTTYFFTKLASILQLSNKRG